MQKNVPKYTPDFVAHGAAVGRDLEAGRVLRAVQRPPHAAVVRQPAGRSSTTRPSSGPTTRPHDPPRARPRPARGRRRFAVAVARGPARAPGARRPRAGGRGEDERRQGPPRVRADRRATSMEDAAAATRAIAARAAALDPERRHDRVREGRARRQGVRRRDPRRRRHRRSRPTARGSGRACRCRSRSAGTTSTTSRPATSPCTPRSTCLGDRDPWAEHMPEPQPLSAELVEEGAAIPVGRVQAMHEGKRRARVGASRPDLLRTAVDPGHGDAPDHRPSVQATGRRLGRSRDRGHEQRPEARGAAHLPGSIDWVPRAHATARWLEWEEFDQLMQEHGRRS